jgi:hypothetical protein
MAKHLPTIRQGDDYKVRVNFPAGTDITGARFFLTLKNSFDDDDGAAVLQWVHLVGSGENDDAQNGFCLIAIPASVTAQIPAGAYLYDFQATFANNERVTLAPPIEEYKVKLTVIPQVTRA